MAEIPTHLMDTVYLGDVMELMRQLPDRSKAFTYSPPCGRVEAYPIHARQARQLWRTANKGVQP
jgi:hypothetical protein